MSILAVINLLILSIYVCFQHGLIHFNMNFQALINDCSFHWCLFLTIINLHVLGIYICFYHWLNCSYSNLQALINDCSQYSGMISTFINLLVFVIDCCFQYSFLIILSTNVLFFTILNLHVLINQWLFSALRFVFIILKLLVLNIFVCSSMH